MTGYSFSYYPIGIYNFMIGIADKHGLSVKEVETVLIRKGITELGFVCRHPSERVKKAKKDKTKVYCGICWTRLEQTEAGVYNGRKLIKSAKYRTLPTFLEGSVYKKGEIHTLTTEEKRELI